MSGAVILACLVASTCDGLGSSVAQAEEPARAAAEAERYRLEIELDRHARASRWKGVERAYSRLLALQLPLSTASHYAAALSAQADGDVNLTWNRLERAIRHSNALKAAPNDDGTTVQASLPTDVDISNEATKAAIEQYNRLSSTYGRVSISVQKGRIPALVRMGAKPFGADERSAISSGQETLASSRRYVGLLPVGKYMVDGEVFEVQPAELTIVRVGSFDAE